MKTGKSERRQNRRYADKAIRMILLDPVGRVLDEAPALKDVSMGGARVATKFPFVLGESVRFSMRLPGGGSSTGFAKVRWAAAGAQEFGMEFVDFGWGGLERLQAVLEPGTAAGVLFSKDAAFGSRLDRILLAACFFLALTLLRAAMFAPFLPASRHANRSVFGAQDVFAQVQSNVSGNQP